MKNLADRLADVASAAIVKACGEGADIRSHLPADIAQSQHAHYQCNTPLRLAKALKTNPRAVAEAICQALHSDLIASTEVSGPGFINIHLNIETLSKELTQIFADQRLGVDLPAHKERIIVEFSSPNVAKELHVGHLRSTIIGDCLARLFEFLGHDVIRLNHIGDWGTQFGMLITYIQDHGLPPEADLSTLMAYYRAAKTCFDADPLFKKRSQENVVRLQAGDPAALELWKTMCAISAKGYRAIYELLDVRLQDRGESFYNPLLPALVDDLVQRGIAVDSEGAKCIFIDGIDVPFMIQKSDGGYGYATTDMAALVQRIQEEKADRIICVVDAGQRLHFDLLKASAIKAGYLDPSKVHFEHVQFGVVLGADGKKFKTRSGETERLIDLLNKAVERARELLKERALPESEAKILGINAVKYADLSNQRIKDYLFSYDRMLAFEGNTASYLLYSYVRIQGIKRKLAKESTGRIALRHPSEIALGLHLRQFGEILDAMARDLMPHRLTDYLYTLAEKFNAFYRDCPVEGSPEEETRLSLSELTAKILHQGLEILGIKTLHRM